MDIQGHCHRPKMKNKNDSNTKYILEYNKEYHLTYLALSQTKIEK